MNKNKLICVICFLFLFNCCQTAEIKPKLKLQNFNYTDEKNENIFNIDESIIKIKRMYRDDFGYVNIEGTLNPGISELKINNDIVDNSKAPAFFYRMILRKNKKIFFQVKKTDGSLKTIEFEDNDAPREPQGVELSSVMQNRIDIRWSENNEKDLYGYNVYLYCSKHGWRKMNRDDELIKKTEYSISSGILPGNNYKIKISAYDFLRNESDYSNEIELTTPGIHKDCCD